MSEDLYRSGGDPGDGGPSADDIGASLREAPPTPDFIDVDAVLSELEKFDQEYNESGGNPIEYYGAPVEASQDAFDPSAWDLPGGEDDYNAGPAASGYNGAEPVAGGGGPGGPGAEGYGAAADDNAAGGGVEKKRKAKSRRGLILMRAGLVGAVVCVCSLLGYFGVKFITGAGLVVPSETRAEVEKERATAPHLYDFNDMTRRYADRSGYDDSADIVNNAGQGAEPEEEVYGTPVIGMLYPFRVDAISGRVSNYYNFLGDLSSRIDFAPPANADDNSATGEVAGEDGKAGDDATGDDPGGPADDPNAPSGGPAAGEDGKAGKDATGEGPGVQAANPVIPVTDPFPITILSFNAVGDVLMSGNLLLMNNTELTIQNAFFMLTLTYEFAGGDEQRTQFAYTKFINIHPGEEAAVSYAAIPPERGAGAPFRLEGITLAAFDTLIDGETRMIYNDVNRAQLEILAAGAD